MVEIDLHTHSALSDGTDTIPELLRAAQSAGLDVIALTDHDTMDGVESAQEYGRAIGVEVLRGMEMSADLEVGGVTRSIHLLVYGPQPGDPELEALLASIRESRQSRIPRMLELLAGLGMTLDLGQVQAYSARSVTTGRPHIADAMVASHYVSSRDEAFQKYLYEGGPAYVERYTPSFAEAVAAINQAHGLIVLAHPWGRGNAALLTPQVIARLAADFGLYGIEVDHVDHTELERRQLRELADDLGLAATGASDYHGKGKTRNPLGVFRTAPGVYQALRIAIEQTGGLL